MEVTHDSATQALTSTGVPTAIKLETASAFIKARAGAHWCADWSLECQTDLVRVLTNRATLHALVAGFRQQRAPKEDSNKDDKSHTMQDQFERDVALFRQECIELGIAEDLVPWLSLQELQQHQTPDLVQDLLSRKDMLLDLVTDCVYELAVRSSAWRGSRGDIKRRLSATRKQATTGTSNLLACSITKSNVEGSQWSSLGSSLKPDMEIDVQPNSNTSSTNNNTNSSSSSSSSNNIDVDHENEDSISPNKRLFEHLDCRVEKLPQQYCATATTAVVATNATDAAEFDEDLSACFSLPGSRISQVHQQPRGSHGPPSGRKLLLRKHSAIGSNKRLSLGLGSKSSVPAGLLGLIHHENDEATTIEQEQEQSEENGKSQGHQQAVILAPRTTSTPSMETKMKTKMKTEITAPSPNHQLHASILSVRQRIATEKKNTTATSNASIELGAGSTNSKEDVARLEANVTLLETSLALVRREMEESQAEVQGFNLKNETLRKQHTQWLKELTLLRTHLQALRTDATTANQNLQTDFESSKNEILNAVTQAGKRTNKFKLLFEAEEKRRRQLLNTVHHLRGNVRVLCRIRPSVPGEEGENLSVKRISSERVAVITTGPESITNSTTSSNRIAKGKTPSSSSAAADIMVTSRKEFEFDDVCGPESTQAEVFKQVQPLVESVVDGYSGSIFAYGQTGSGKTWTMSGECGTDNAGINYRALQELFSLVERRASAHFEYTISVSIVEVYNEMVRDLLDVGNSSSSNISISSSSNNLPIREGPDGVFLPDCKTTTVNSVKHVWELMASTQAARISASTNMNAQSSRSHCVVMVNLHGTHAPTGTTTKGKLVLVDLAGSERLSRSGAVGDVMKEAQHINKSLSALGDVIGALMNPKATHVPFRNSKLTYLLKDTLGHDNKALMVVHVSPVQSSAQESSCTLQFGTRVRSVRLGKATRNHKNQDASLGELKKAQVHIRNVQASADEQIRMAESLKRELSATHTENDNLRVIVQENAHKSTVLQTEKEDLARAMKTLEAKLELARKGQEEYSIHHEMQTQANLEAQRRGLQAAMQEQQHRQEDHARAQEVTYRTRLAEEQRKHEHVVKGLQNETAAMRERQRKAEKANQVLVAELERISAESAEKQRLVQSLQKQQQQQQQQSQLMQQHQQKAAAVAARVAVEVAATAATAPLSPSLALFNKPPEKQQQHQQLAGTTKQTVEVATLGEEGEEEETFGEHEISLPNVLLPKAQETYVTLPDAMAEEIFASNSGILKIAEEEVRAAAQEYANVATRTEINNEKENCSSATTKTKTATSRANGKATSAKAATAESHVTNTKQQQEQSKAASQKLAQEARVAAVRELRAKRENERQKRAVELALRRRSSCVSTAATAAPPPPPTSKRQSLLKPTAADRTSTDALTPTTTRTRTRTHRGNDENTHGVVNNNIKQKTHATVVRETLDARTSARKTARRIANEPHTPPVKHTGNVGAHVRTPSAAATAAVNAMNAHMAKQVRWKHTPQLIPRSTRSSSISSAHNINSPVVQKGDADNTKRVQRNGSRASNVAAAIAGGSAAQQVPASTQLSLSNEEVTSRNGGGGGGGKPTTTRTSSKSKSSSSNKALGMAAGRVLQKTPGKSAVRVAPRRVLKSAKPTWY